MFRSCCNRIVIRDTIFIVGPTNFNAPTQIETQDLCKANEPDFIGTDTNHWYYIGPACQGSYLCASFWQRYSAYDIQAITSITLFLCMTSSLLSIWNKSVLKLAIALADFTWVFLFQSRNLSLSAFEMLPKSQFSQFSSALRKFVPNNVKLTPLNYRFLNLTSFCNRKLWLLAHFRNNVSAIGFLMQIGTFVKVSDIVLPYCKYCIMKSRVYPSTWRLLKALLRVFYHTQQQFI